MLRFLKQRLSQWLRREDSRYELSLVVFTLVLRICTSVIQSGPDPNQKWGFVRQVLAGGFPTSGEFNHHHARWGVHLPVFIVQILFGSHAANVAIAPIAFAIALSLLLYHLGKRLNGPVAGIAAAVLANILPSSGRMLSVTHTMAFEWVYLLVALYALIKSAEVRHQRWLALSCISAFLAYLAKETTVFALPGIAYYAWISRQRLRDAFVFCGSFLVLFLIETLLYRLAFGFTLGRLSIIKRHHLHQAKLQVPMKFWQLFERYTQLEPLLTFLFYGALLASICTPFWFRYKRRERVPTVLKGTLAVTWSFYFLTTFSLKSINPLLPAQPPLVRYLFTGVPFLALVVGWALVEWGEPLVRPIKAKINARAVLVALPLLTAAGHWLVRQQTWSRTGIARTIKAEHDVQKAFLAGNPIIVKEAKPYIRNIERSVRFLYLTHEQSKRMVVLNGSPRVRAIVDRRRPEFKQPTSELSKQVLDWDKTAIPVFDKSGFAIARLNAKPQLQRQQQKRAVNDRKKRAPKHKEKARKPAQG